MVAGVSDLILLVPSKGHGAHLTEGDVIKAGISIESREFNGKWYTDVRAYNLGLVSSAPQQAVVEQPQPQTQPTCQQAEFFGTNDDDLPF